jgi:hypothetical protein
MGKHAPEKLYEIWEVSMECLDISEEIVVPGAVFRETWEAIRRPAQKPAYDSVELGWHAMSVASSKRPAAIYRLAQGPLALNGSRMADLRTGAGCDLQRRYRLRDQDWKVGVGCLLSDFMAARPGPSRTFERHSKRIARGRLIERGQVIGVLTVMPISLGQ